MSFEPDRVEELKILALFDLSSIQEGIKVHKTAVQMIAIMLLLYYQPLIGVDTQLWGTALIWVAALLTLVSMLYYLKMAARALKTQHAQVDNSPSSRLL